jgi:acetylornithine deacetylase/succinyl-diaminopimelate desuccinylase-like protein
MVELLGRLDGHQPDFDRYPEAEAALSLLLGKEAGDPAEALEQLRALDGRLADLVEPMLGVTVAPTMIHASDKENVIPSRCSVRVDCRVPPGFGREHALRRVEQLLGKETESKYRLHFDDEIVGNSSPLKSDLTDAISSYLATADPGVELAPFVLSGFTDSHWFRKAFPECVAYGFFPQRAMTLFDTTPLVHAADERIAIDDLEYASKFFYALPLRVFN